jgi:hypothetical protein
MKNARSRSVDKNAKYRIIFLSPSSSDPKVDLNSLTGDISRFRIVMNGLSS